ncbi:hypothetical protein [Endozoicomonas sp. ALD040]
MTLSKKIRYLSKRAVDIKLLLPSAINGFGDVNAPVDSRGGSFLKYALKARDIESLRKLIDRDARVTGKDREGADRLLNYYKDK